MESKPKYPDYYHYPAWKLDEEAKLIKENVDTIHYGEEGSLRQRTRLGLIALELLSRQLENHGYVPGEAIIGLGVDYFGYNAEPKGRLLGRATVNLNS